MCKVMIRLLAVAWLLGAPAATFTYHVRRNCTKSEAAGGGGVKDGGREEENPRPTQRPTTPRRLAAKYPCIQDWDAVCTKDSECCSGVCLKPFCKILGIEDEKGKHNSKTRVQGGGKAGKQAKFGDMQGKHGNTNAEPPTKVGEGWGNYEYGNAGSPKKIGESWVNYEDGNSGSPTKIGESWVNYEDGNSGSPTPGERWGNYEDGNERSPNKGRAKYSGLRGHDKDVAQAVPPNKTGYKRAKNIDVNQCPKYFECCTDACLKQLCKSLGSEK